jgi:hypothetical protein
MLLCDIAAAKARPGRYRLELAAGREPPKTTYPSCGSRATDFISSVGVLNIEAAANVLINGVVWSAGPEPSTGATSVVNEKLLEGFVVQVSFWGGAEAASGMIMVVGLSEDGTTRCVDAARLAGRYRR